MISDQIVVTMQYNCLKFVVNITQNEFDSILQIFYLTDLVTFINKIIMKYCVLKFQDGGS